MNKELFTNFKNSNHKLVIMKITTQSSTIYISNEIDTILTKIEKEIVGEKVFILVDENTKVHCLPRIQNIDFIANAELIEIESGEKNKSIDSVIRLWEFFQNQGANRSSTLINLGGGLICDLGGFAASTFKRGFSFINIPTTLLSQVDASVGGKTGFNFGGLKNEIGVFKDPKHVLIDSSFIKTLDKRNILSGWAEMIKHSLIFDSKDWQNIFSHNVKQTGYKELNQLIERSVNIKKYFVEQDPKEQNIRKALNFGHTIGHAFESLFMNTDQKILHGEAVAHGIICELYLSYKLCGFPLKQVENISKYLFSEYGKLNIEDNAFDKIFLLIQQDKKNDISGINFTLLEDFGKIKINQHGTKEQIVDTLNWYRTL